MVSVPELLSFSSNVYSFFSTVRQLLTKIRSRTNNIEFFVFRIMVVEFDIKSTKIRKSFSNKIMYFYGLYNIYYENIS